MKERVDSSARNGDGEGGTNDVYASRIFSSRLGRPDKFCGSPVGNAVFWTLGQNKYKPLGRQAILVLLVLDPLKLDKATLVR